MQNRKRDTEKNKKKKKKKEKKNVLLVEKKNRDFSGGPVVKTPHFHCMLHGFNLWSMN